jgi:hypothetical protein
MRRQQIIGQAGEDAPKLGYPMTLLRFPAYEVPDVAYFEPLTTAFYLHDPVHVRRYARYWMSWQSKRSRPARQLSI